MYKLNIGVKQMNDTELEQELQVRIMFHKTAVLGTTLMKEYIDKNTAVGEPNIPDFIVKQQASVYTDNVIQSALATGTFNDMYESAWQKILEVMPEHANFVELSR